MNFEDLSNKIPYTEKEISSKKTPEETSQRKKLSILPMEQSPASIELVKYNIENKTTPAITANYTSNKKKLNEAIVQCEKEPQNVYNLAYLKRLINLYEPTLDPINSFLIKLLSIGPFGKANDTYNETLNKLTDNQKKQTKTLVKSFEETQWINGLYLPEGLYSGPVKNGLPHTDKNSLDFSKGTLLSSDSMHYAGEFKEGKIHGKGIAVRPISQDKKEPPIKLEGLFENGKFIGKIISWNEGEYAGPTRPEINQFGDFNNNSTEDIKFNGKCTVFINDKISIFNGVFENDTLIEGTVNYHKSLNKEPLILTQDSEPLPVFKTGKWEYIGHYSTEIPHGKNGVFYLDKDRWEGDFENGFLKEGTKFYEDKTREDGIFVDNKLWRGTAQKGNVTYSIDRKMGGNGLWKINDLKETRMGTFSKIQDEYQLDGYNCTREYTLNGIDYKDVGQFKKGIFKEGIRSFTTNDGKNVTEQGVFRKEGISKPDELMPVKISTGSITSIDSEGNETVLTTLPENDKWPKGFFFHVENDLTPRIVNHGSFEDKSVIKEGYFTMGNFTLGKLTLKDKGEVYETVDGYDAYNSKNNRGMEEGKFVQGEALVGEGKITRSDGTSEEGNFKDNKLHGPGKIVIKNKDSKLVTITGTFKNGEMIEKTENNKTYTPDRELGGKIDEYGQLQGEGTMQMGNAYAFHGKFKDNLPHGEMSLQNNYGMVTEYYQEGYKVEKKAWEDYIKKNT